MSVIPRSLVSCSLAVTFALTPVTGALDPEEPDPVVATTLSVCRAAIGRGATNDGTAVTGFPGPDYRSYRIYFGRVGLPTVDEMQASPSGLDDPSAEYFAKAGLYALPGKPFTLIVPRRWRDRLSIAWGGARRTLRLRVDLACVNALPPGTWVAYPGGFWIDRPACAPLTIKTARSTKRVHLGIGKACEGQAA
jgi:hypothetical protein